MDAKIKRLLTPNLLVSFMFEGDSIAFSKFSMKAPNLIEPTIKLVSDSTFCYTDWYSSFVDVSMASTVD